MMRAGAMLLVAVFVGGVAWANDSTKKEGTKLTWSEISQIKKLSRRGAKIWLEYKDHIDDSGRPKKVDRPGKDHISITQNFHGVSSASISEAATIDKPGVTTKVTVGRALGEKTPGSIEMKRVFFTFGGADKLVVTSKNTFSGFTWKAGLLGKRVIVPESLTFEVTTNGQTRTIDRKDVAEHAQRLGLVNVMREKGAGKFVGRRWFRGKFFRGRKK